MNWLGSKNNASLQQEPADLVDQCRAPLDQARAHAVHGLQIELLVALDLNEAHVLLLHGIGDRLGIEEVTLVRLAVRLHELCSHEPHVMSLFTQRPCQEMSPGTGFSPHQGGLQVGGKGQQLLTRKLPPDKHAVTFSHSNQVKHVFTEIDTDRYDTHEMILLL